MKPSTALPGEVIAIDQNDMAKSQRCHATDFIKLDEKFQHLFWRSNLIIILRIYLINAHCDVGGDARAWALAVAYIHWYRQPPVASRISLQTHENLIKILWFSQTHISYTDIKSIDCSYCTLNFIYATSQIEESCRVPPPKKSRRDVGIMKMKIRLY